MSRLGHRHRRRGVSRLVRRNAPPDIVRPHPDRRPRSSCSHGADEDFDDRLVLGDKGADIVALAAPELEQRHLAYRHVESLLVDICSQPVAATFSFLRMG